MGENDQRPDVCTLKSAGKIMGGNFKKGKKKFTIFQSVGDLLKRKLSIRF
jgi:hypothetical protein